MLKKIAIGAFSLLVITAFSFEFGAAPAYASKVDCGKVMADVGAGKKTKDIAAEMKISTSSVYRCKQKAKTSAPKTAAATSPAAATSAPSHK